VPHSPFEPLNVLACPGVARLPGHVAATNRAAILRQSRATSSFNPSPESHAPPFRLRSPPFLCLFSQVAWRPPVLLGFNLWALQYFANIRSISCGDSADSIAINSQEFAGVCVWRIGWVFGSKCPSIDILHLLLARSWLFCLSPFYWLWPSICLFRLWKGRVWQGGDGWSWGRDSYCCCLLEGSAWLINRSADKLDPLAGL